VEVARHVEQEALLRRHLHPMWLKAAAGDGRARPRAPACALSHAIWCGRMLLVGAPPLARR
jgi:hypothetical protein